MKTLLGLVLAVGILLPSAAVAQNAEPDLKAGKATFVKWCAPCHGEGIYMTGTNALRAKYKDAKPALLEQRTDLTPEFVKGFVRKGAGLMAPFRKTEISDAELDALAAYLSRKEPR
jgi:mono/diheme cytochrome c family protein